MRGFLLSRISQERRFEAEASAVPNSATALRDELALAGHVHRMGELADYRTALYVRARLAADGWDAKIVTYDVGIAWPTFQYLAITSPPRRDIDLYEPVIASDPYSKDHRAIGKPWSGYSNDGDASGPLYYVNYGTAGDFALLGTMGVDLHGAVLIAKMGHGSADSKGRRAQLHGARALLIYPEPGYDPYFQTATPTKPYPAGPARPLGAALRNTMLIEYPPGDPTAIGVPVPGAKHAPFSSLRVPAIPVSTITALVAQQLEAGLGGPPAPRAWATKATPSIRIGGSERVHFVLRSRRFIGPMWDVIATMPGQDAPAESVVIGGHRDAWTYGAVDPISGTVAMLQLGDALGELRKSGWRPWRTVTIGSWDGEELDLFGSSAWADQRGDRLRRGCWAYLNTDEVAFGPTFFAYGTDDLKGLLRSVAADTRAPDGSTVAQYWAKQDRYSVISPPGTGSDHEPFTYHLGIPSAGIAYGGIFGTYHSAYDDPASLRVFDPGMRFADAAARFYVLATLRLADAPYPDVRLRDDAEALAHRLNTFANAPGNETRRIAVVRALEPQIANFSQLAAAVDDAVDQAAVAGNSAQLASLRNLMFSIRSSFFDPAGIPGAAWQGSLLYNSDDAVSTLPSLEATLDPATGAQALNQILAAFERVPPLLLIYEEQSAGRRAD